ncbi:MAG: hypothetical protein Q4P17_11220 [Methanobacterium sp.]|nr:hypothetical protein [Methanobacterium sp.]
MLQLNSFFGKIELTDQVIIEKIIISLRNEGYSPLLRDMFINISKLAKIPEPDKDFIKKILIQEGSLKYRRRRSRTVGDVFFTDNYVYVINPLNKSIQVSAFGYNDFSDELETFSEIINTSLKNENINKKISWEKVNLNRLRSNRSIYIREDEHEQINADAEFKKPEYSNEDLQIVNCLKNVDNRKFIIKLAQLKGIMEHDALNEIDRTSIEKLKKSGLITEEYLLKCKEDQHTICQVPSKEHLEADLMKNLQCNCGRSFKNEDLKTIYKLTDNCKKLINGSLWMSIWITEVLRKNGTDIDKIKWGIEANGEEIDIMVEDFGLRIVFELKDREFGLGDSYPFVYRIDRFNGNLGIIATTDKVSKDAKRFFEEQTHRRDSNIKYLEGLDGIQSGIKETIEQLSRNQARELVSNISGPDELNIWPFIETWMDTKLMKLKENNQ